ncbi:hypothetical protein ACQJBY_006905 [Aegilops geniculata]
MPRPPVPPAGERPTEPAAAVDRGNPAEPSRSPSSRASNLDPHHHVLATTPEQPSRWELTPPPSSTRAVVARIRRRPAGSAPSPPRRPSLLPRR